MTRFAADIVADLRARIVAGDLKPGEFLPTAKEIMAGWGATTATAYKAMELLRQEGLAAKVVRGIGLVVTADAPAVAAAWAPPPARGDLVRARIVTAAVELADRDGLANLSLRLIGERAGGLVSGTFYKWVRDRAELETLMAGAVFAGHPPPKPAGTWRAQLERLARLQWRMYRRHAWLARTVSFTAPGPSPHVTEHTDAAARALRDRGCSPAEAADLALAVASLVRGCALALESEDPRARRAEADAAEPQFAFGLARLLDGFERG
ncbi:TetR/AcrR family transcriptional regulator C-terminal domain-containing protein [Dactylosporangium vinaceum]|uniref:TetR/AcrR family transcriptional regulator C-terminal domain-containing protein n=1 Tax=Dactylosporangium vinaceum TaxID=53362 RepID=A0ABV5MEG9_9ACTN|nr:TetR/AcrR family transcriptional regulator C-terminal domain-containing protein [Dactylosporangium vinaceum]UAB92400.1 TetR/AcrR family transcriptional regulator C-terminal domain-containing protein [Dactylosporangium vinaceum]